jgi:hypothetical protein
MEPDLVEYQSIFPQSVEAPTVAESPEQIVALDLVKVAGYFDAKTLIAVLPLPQTPFHDST